MSNPTPATAKPLSKALKFWYGAGDFGFTLMTNVETFYFNAFLTNVAGFSTAMAGTIASIDGVEELGNDSNIVKVIFNKSVGQQIAPTGDFSQNCALIHFLFDTQQELDQTIDLIHSTLRVVNTDGADQLVEPMRADLTAFLER